MPTIEQEPFPGYGRQDLFLMPKDDSIVALSFRVVYWLGHFYALRGVMIRDSSNFFRRLGLLAEEDYPVLALDICGNPPHGASEEQMNWYTKYVRSVSDCSSVLYIDVSPKDFSLET